MPSNIIAPIFNFENRNNQRCFVKNRELMLFNYLRLIVDCLTVLFYFSCSENFLKLFRKSPRTMKNFTKCWRNVIKRLYKSLARARK